jgi:hypothetical protein
MWHRLGVATWPDGIQKVRGENMLKFFIKVPEQFRFFKATEDETDIGYFNLTYLKNSFGAWALVSKYVLPEHDDLRDQHIHSYIKYAKEVTDNKLVISACRYFLNRRIDYFRNLGFSNMTPHLNEDPLDEAGKQLLFLLTDSAVEIASTYGRLILDLDESLDEKTIFPFKPIDGIPDAKIILKT